MKKLFLILMLTIVGFFIGYIYFGRTLGERLPLESIFISDTDNYIGAFIDELAIKPIRQKILLSSLFGGIIGILISVVLSKKTKSSEQCRQSSKTENLKIETVQTAKETFKKSKKTESKKIPSKYFIIAGISIITILSLIIFINIRNVDYSDPKSTILEYIKLTRELSDEEIYDNILSKESKNNITKEEFINIRLNAFNHKNKNFITDSIFEIPVENSSFKRFKNTEIQNINNEYIKTKKYYTLRNEDGNWKIVWVGNLYTLGIEYANSGNYNKAIEYFKKCIELNPYHGESYEQIGWCYTSRNNSATREEKERESLKHAKIALSLEDDIPSHYLLLSQYYNEINNKTLSLEFLKKGLDICTSNEDKIMFYSNISQLLYSMENFSESISYLNKSLELSQDNTFSWFLYAKIQQANKNYDEALKCYKKAIELKEMDSFFQSELYANYSNLCNYFNNCSEAKVYILKALKMQPDNQYFQSIYNAVENCK